MTDVYHPPFDIIEPAQVLSPLLFNSPHSGDDYPDDFLAGIRLGRRELRRSADLFVDKLFSGVVAQGMPLMRAHFPRSFVDVNREPYELDPRMFDGRTPAFANTRSLRVTSGFGTIARYAGDSQEIYGRRIPVEEAFRRIDCYYLPYHAALRMRLGDIHRTAGEATLIDCHSMPSVSSQPRTAMPDFVLGDRFGTSCAAPIVDFVDSFLAGHGFTLARNQPYAGGFITEHYGNPVAGLHALQIEINRGLYMDEALQQPHSGFGAIATLMSELAAGLATFLHQTRTPLPLAAE